MDAIEKHLYRLLLGAVVLLIAGGTVFYHMVEKLSYLDAYYFSVVTLTTVGYGDITPHTVAGKLFTTFYILVGVGIITTFFGFRTRRRGEKVKEHQANRQK